VCVGDVRIHSTRAALDAQLWQRDNLEKTLLVLDWDDTLMCSSWITRMMQTLQHGLPPTSPNRHRTVSAFALAVHKDRSLVDAEAKRELHLLSESVKGLLLAARRVLPLRNIVIVTNAVPGWVQLSAEVFLRSALKALGGMRIVSARSAFETMFPDQPDCWKAATFSHEVSEAMKGHNGALKRIVSIGDSLEERNGCACTSLHFGIKGVSVSMMRRPTPALLCAQLDAVKANLIRLCCTEESWIEMGCAFGRGRDANAIDLRAVSQQQPVTAALNNSPREAANADADTDTDSVATSAEDKDSIDAVLSQKLCIAKMMHSLSIGTWEAPGAATDKEPPTRAHTHSGQKGVFDSICPGHEMSTADVDAAAAAAADDDDDDAATTPVPPPQPQPASQLYVFGKTPAAPGRRRSRMLANPVSTEGFSPTYTPRVSWSPVPAPAAVPEGDAMSSPPRRRRRRAATSPWADNGAQALAAEAEADGAAATRPFAPVHGYQHSIDSGVDAGEPMPPPPALAQVPQGPEGRPLYVEIGNGARRRRVRSRRQTSPV